MGESFSGYELYKYSSTITEDIGTKGLVYTLNSVRVYDSFYEAELGDTAHLCDNPVELEKVMENEKFCFCISEFPVRKMIEVTISK